MRVQAVIVAAFVALAAGAFLPRSWNATIDHVVTITTTICPRTCSETCTVPVVKTSTKTTTTTVTETIYVTITQNVTPTLPTPSSNPESDFVCAAPKSEGTALEFGTSLAPSAKSPITNTGNENNPSPPQSTRTVTVYPIPLSEYTTLVTSQSTGVVTLTLVDPPDLGDLEKKPVQQWSTVETASSIQASQTSNTPPAPLITTPPAISTTVISNPPKAYGSNGWNSTSSATATGQGTGTQAILGTANPESSTRSKLAITVLKKRQLGAMVTATIDGQVVSWANDWDGSAPSSTRSPLTLTSTTTTTQAIATPSSTPEKCGESGEFTIDFDGLPGFATGANSSSFPPIFNPYYHFFFSDGWSYGPPPAVPYPSISKPYIGIYVPSKHKENRGSPYAGLLDGGQFGAGPRSGLDTFWFDTYSAYFGCDNGSPNTPCEITVSAVKYSTTTKKEEPAGMRSFTLPSCPDYKNCALSKLDFGDSFRAISGLQFSATVAGEPVIWFVDDIEMNWYNNTCAAGLERLRHRR
ncbi:hypothetical protein AJ79_04323 [Helicocarpus griseus UAMH5409]|uniref:DUF7371 domain-containing protein n=1 Tax=Helicocarpus griseus UAMH5409 TaxID=1447875 RepID=A0A2B7XTW3_9EURO|nr:hypothetical protein AJ79_04323 [Helicocarpus griseus UAMH5409]